ncbi:MAG: VWA domain-containing protein [Deltaproteobacteria bacterium]|nr:VWA domain-containing protein [Deltaproteobacteria bacterium]
MHTSTRKLQSLIWVVVTGFAALSCGPSGNGDGRTATPFDPKATAGADGRGGGGGSNTGSGNRDGGADEDANPFVIDFPDALQGEKKDANLDKKDTLESCGGSAFQVTRVPPDLMVVLDRSGSMMRTTDGKNPLNPADMAAGQTVRWNYTRLALNTVMTATDSDVAWGLKMYPTCKAGTDPTKPYECLPEACAINGLSEVPDLGKAAALSTLIVQNTPQVDRGATPTAPAVAEAVATLKARNNGRPKYILLATDGQPNCGIEAASMTRKDSVDDAAGAVAAVAAAKAAGIDVFVLGIAIKDPAATTDAGLLKAHQTLNMMADAGGRARMGDIKYYPATNEADIKAAVTEIAAAAVSCSLPLAQPPQPDALARVDADGMQIPESATEGWMFGPNKGSVVLTGSFCAKRKAGELKKVIVSFGCPGKEPPPPPLAL